MPKVQIETAITVEAKQAEKQIKDFNRAMSTIAGQKTVFINAKLEGADEIQKRLKESIEGLKGIKFDNKGVMTQILGIEDARKALRQLESELGKTAGNARAAIQNKIGRVSAYIGAYNEAIDYRSNQIRSGRAVSSQRQLGKYYNEGRQVRIQQINENLAIARQNNDYREQLSLLKEKVKLLEKIDKANRSKTPSVDLLNARQELESIRQENKQRKEAIRQDKEHAREMERQENVRSRVIKQYQQQYGILGGLGSRLRSYLSIYTLANFGQKVAETTGYFEKQQVALEGILGSASKAQSVLSQIKDFALKSPFQTKELVSFTKQLSAFSIPADELFETTKRLADLSAGLGVDMSRIILAYGQVRAAAVLRGQELRQFTEAGIPLVQKLADKFTQLRGEVVTTADVFELISKRQVSFQMVADVLSDMTKEGGQFYKMQENITETLYGQIQKLQDIWTIQMDKMGKGSGSFFMGVVKLLQMIAQNTQGVASGLIIAFTLDWAVRNIRKMRMEWDLLDVKTKKTIGSLKQFRMLRLAEFGKNIGWGVAAAAAGVAIGAIVTHLQKLQEVQKKMDEVSDHFSKETNKMIGGFDGLVVRLRSAKEGTQAYNDAIETLKSNYGEFININEQTIQTLLSEKEAVNGTTSEFEKLRSEIAAAIKLKQQYNELKTQKETLGDTVSANATGSKFWGTGYKGANNVSVDYIRNILASIYGPAADNKEGGRRFNALFGTHYDDKSAVKKIQQDLDKMAAATLSEYTSNGYTTKDEFTALYSRNFKNAFLGNQFSTSDPRLQNAIKNLATSIFNGLQNSSGWSEYTESVQKLEGKGTDLLSMMIRVNKEFDSYNAGNNNGIGAVGKQQWTNNEYAQLLRNSVNNEFGSLGGDAAKLKSLKDTLDTFISNNATGNYDENGVRNITNALKAFFDTINDAERGQIVETATKRFKEGTDALTEQEAKIANRMEKGNTWSGINRGKVNNVDLQGYIDNYNPAALGEQTVQQTRDKIRSAYDELRKELKTYTKNPENFKDDIALINAKMRILERLAKGDLYSVDLTEKKGGSGAGGGWRRMFSDLFGYIKEARAEEKKLVEHSAGLTTDLAKQINSKQLEGTAVNAFWSEGSPFKRFIDKMDEYGLESEIFSKDFLQGALSKIATKQIESTGTINYEDVWKQLIEVIKGRIDKLSLDPKMKSTVDTMKTYLQQMVLEGEKFFGRDKVEKLIEDQLKEMRKINGQFDKLRSEQKAIDSIRESSNALRAYQALGSRGYTSNAEVTRQQLQSLLSAGGGKGLSLATPLAQLINGGKLGIAGIGQILAVKQSLSGISTKDMKGDDEDARQANFKEFQGVLNQFDQLLGQLVNDIEEDFKRLMELKDPTMKASDDIINAVDEFRKALELIANGIENGDISKPESEAMSVQALQNLFGGISKGLGGNGMQDFINRLYKQEGTDIGVSSTGFGVGMWLNKGSLAEKYANMQAQMVASRKQDLDYELERGDITQEQYDAELEKATKAAADATLDFASKMELTAAIIQKVDGYIQKGAQFANKLIDAMDANNGLTTDEYGNYTYENDYSEAKKAVNMIAEFSSGISGAIQSFMQGDIFGGIMGIGTSIAGFFENLFGIGDAKIQRQQDKLISSNKSLERALTNLEHAINGVAGIDKWKNYTEQIEKLKQQEANNKKLEELEVSKKHGDKDKAESYRDAAEEARRQIEDIIRGIQEEIFGTADELASQLTDALVEAFRNGENAARAWRNAVRSYIGDVLKEVLMTKVIAPQIDSLLDQFVGGATDPKEILKKFSDPAAAVGLRNALMSLSDEMIDGFNNLPQAIQEMIAWNQDTSELSGGIQGITEDTARTLEGLSNSMLAQLVLIQRSVLVLEGSGFAQVQTSWFNDMLNQQRALRQAADSINNILTASRDGVRYLHVQMH